MNPLVFKPAASLRGLVERLSPRQRQYAMLVAIMAGGVGMLWLIFSFADEGPKDKAPRPTSGQPVKVTSIGLMAPGQQVNPVDQWVGTAGSKLAQYENERDEQTRLNKERQAFEGRTMQRFAELEQRLTAANNAGGGATTAPLSPAAPPVAMPPAANFPLPPPPMPYRPGTSPAMPPGVPPGPGAGPLTAPAPLPAPVPAMPVLTRVTLVDRTAQGTGQDRSPSPAGAASEARTVSTFLPVSFTRGTLIGGLDAPTGGQSQSNPHPVLIRLSDNAVLPNRFRGEYRDCFVIAAGYGDISSERAYLRTESLSCVRPDGGAIELKIQGSIYGEDGKVGMRGRLVTKQGQMLANALLAGVVSGIGQGLASSSTSYSTSALGTIASASGADGYRAGLGSGVGRALDRLAQYYIKLAENTFPVIEIDAGREIDVVITKGVRVDLPMTSGLATDSRAATRPIERYLEVSDDDKY